MFQGKLVNDYGYPFEKHHIETEDGYKLELHRIPKGSMESKNKTQKPIVFIKHGLADSSASFLFSGPNRSLGDHNF